MELLTSLGGDLLKNLGGNVAEIVGGGVLWIIDLLISLLPLSPFVGITIDGLPREAIGWLNYFVDIARMLTLFTAWLACLVIYFIASRVMDFIKQIDGIKQIIGNFILPTGVGGGE